MIKNRNTAVRNEIKTLRKLLDNSDITPFARIIIGEHTKRLRQIRTALSKDNSKSGIRIKNAITGHIKIRGGR